MKDLLIDFLIAQVNNIWMKILIIELFDVCESRILNVLVPLENMLDTTFHHLEGRQTEKVVFDRDWETSSRCY